MTLTLINKRMRESCLRWFGHVWRRVINALVRKSDYIQVERRKKGRGRPKITLVKIVKNDVSIKEVTLSVILDG